MINVVPKLKVQYDKLDGFKCRPAQDKRVNDFLWSNIWFSVFTFQTILKISQENDLDCIETYDQEIK